MTGQKAIFLLAGFIIFSGFRHAAVYGELVTRPDPIPSAYLPAASSQPIEETRPIPIVLNHSVESYIEYFITSGKMGLHKWFNNSASYLHVMQEIFRDENLPEELAYVAMIESGFDPSAVSRANAVGLWQLMQDTARQYRLRGDQWVDERRDLIKSTRAAARHFRFLHDRLGSWPLVLSAYNAGLTAVRAAIRSTGSNDFWDLRESGSLSRETSDFVPKFMAVVLIARDPAAYGFRVPPPRPICFDLVAVPAATDLRSLAIAIGTTYAKIRSLNPEMSGFFTPPGGYWFLKIPEGKKKAYLSAGNWSGQTATAFAEKLPPCGSLCTTMTDRILHESTFHWFTNPLTCDGMFGSKTAAAEKLLLIGLNRRKISRANKAVRGRGQGKNRRGDSRRGDGENQSIANVKVQIANVKERGRSLDAERGKSDAVTMMQTRDVSRQGDAEEGRSIADCGMEEQSAKGMAHGGVLAR